MKSHSEPANTLRYALRGNATFSLTTGLIAALVSAPVASWLGAFRAQEVLLLGAQLVLFATWLLWLSFRVRIPRWQVLVVLALDVGWVAGSALLLLSPPAALTAAGNYEDAAREEIARRFGRLLSYPEPVIDDLLERQKNSN